MSKPTIHNGHHKSALSRLPLRTATVLAGLALAACAQMPAGHDTPPAAGHADASMAQSAQTKQADAPASSTTNLDVTATMTMSCVPTKEAQALGLVRTEEVQAVYQVPHDNEAGNAVVTLKFGNKSYTLQEAPSASGERYTTADALSPRHSGFSWHSKRNEAIISSLMPASGVNEVVDGPLLYRCQGVN